MLHILNSQNTILNKFVAEIRDKSIQKDSMRFRRNLERIGEVMAYEISKTFEYAVKVVETPLGEASVAMISDQVVIATILRAGLPFHQGFLNYFDDAQNAFVSAYRKSTKDGKFTVKVEYISCGELEGKTLLLVDPMLATGSSLVLAYNAPLRHRIPMIWLGGALATASRTVDTYASQIDICATLLAQMGLPHDEFDYSKNIFGATPPHKFGYYCFSDGFGVIDADGETVYDNTGETVLSQTGPQSERLEWGKAMLQTTYEDIGRR